MIIFLKILHVSHMFLWYQKHDKIYNARWRLNILFRNANEDVNLNNINETTHEEAVKNEKRNSHVSRDSTRIVNCLRASNVSSFVRKILLPANLQESSRNILYVLPTL